MRRGSVSVRSGGRGGRLQRSSHKHPWTSIGPGVTELGVVFSRHIHSGCDVIRHLTAVPSESASNSMKLLGCVFPSGGKVAVDPPRVTWSGVSILERSSSPKMRSRSSSPLEVTGYDRSFAIIATNVAGMTDGATTSRTLHPQWMVTRRGIGGQG